jgi:hypothetical protein
MKLTSTIDRRMKPADAACLPPSESEMKKAMAEAAKTNAALSELDAATRYVLIESEPTMNTTPAMHRKW